VSTAEAQGTWDHRTVARYSGALWAGSCLRVRDSTGARIPFDVVRWLQVADPADETLLDRCAGPTLDVGCGPGRLVAALTARGVPALGVDVATAAVAIARSCGALVLRRSVFDRLPGAGRWSAAMLADGNIGIGGDPAALLARLRELLAPGGLALVEVQAAEVEEHFTAGIEGPDGRIVEEFPWVRLGADALVGLARPLGYATADRWVSEGRHFVALRRL
jgi:SAM-dependent methyltransferase